MPPRIKRSLALLFAVGFPLAAVSAQTPPPAPRPAPSAGSPEGRGVRTSAEENFVLTLSPAGKDGEGVSFIVTSAQTFNSSRAGFAFNGTLARTDSGAYRLDYLLETSAEHGGTIHTGASVILTPGEPVQLVKNGDQFYNLRLDHYPPIDAAKPGPSPGIVH